MAPSCGGCGDIFPFLRATYCAICEIQIAAGAEATSQVPDPSEQCSGCGRHFPLMGNVSECASCDKLRKAPDSDVERQQIWAMKQCQACGCIWSFLKGPYCGACKQALAGPDGRSQGLDSTAASHSRRNAQLVSSAAKTFEKKASGFRLNQKPASKTAAHSAQTAAEVKEKSGDLKDLRGQEYITIEVTGYYSRSVLGARPTQMDGANFICAKIKSSESADAGMDKALKALQSIFANLTKAVQGQLGLSVADFTRATVKFYARKDKRAAGNGHALDDKMVLNKTMAQLFDNLKSMNQITPTNTKDRMVYVNAVIFADLSQDNEAGDAEYDTSMPPPSSRPPHGTAGGRQGSTAKSKSHHGFESSSATSSTASGKRKRLDSNVNSGISESTSKTDNRGGAVQQPLSATVPTSARPRYTSAFRLPTTPPIQYQTLAITRTTVVFDECGELSVISHDYEDDDTIQVAKDWQKMMRVAATDSTTSPRGGWVGGGGSKVAFRGLYKGVPYALAQIGPLGIYSATSQGNASDLLNELKLLALGQYFAQTFHARAEAEGAPNLPNIRFNWEGAFVGKLLHPWDLPKPPSADSGEDDTRILLHDTFLATRLINRSDGYSEQKFSGAEVVGTNTSVVGRAIDAFAHHVCDESQESCILVDLQGFVKDKEVILIDPQAHTEGWKTGRGRSGYWDGGENSIENFRKAHKCNVVCRSLQLPPLVGKERIAVNNLVHRNNARPMATPFMDLTGAAEDA